MDFKKSIRVIQDFPIAGVVFRDITTLLKDAEALRGGIDAMIKTVDDLDFDAVLGPESRGFIFGMPLAYVLKKGFIPVRKAGKLPAEVARKDYTLEYGTASIEIHKDAIVKGGRYVIADDLLATGGTARAIIDLVEEMGGIVVASLFFIELTNLNGREVLKGHDVRTTLVY